jgi:hypothetical protein
MIELNYTKKGALILGFLGLLYWMYYSFIKKVGGVLISLIPDLITPIIFGAVIGFSLDKLYASHFSQERKIITHAVGIIIIIIGLILLWFVREIIWLNIAKPY